MTDDLIRRLRDEANASPYELVICDSTRRLLLKAADALSREGFTGLHITGKPLAPAQAALASQDAQPVTKWCNACGEGVIAGQCRAKVKCAAAPPSTEPARAEAAPTNQQETPK